jgi:hypothetical protein
VSTVAERVLFVDLENVQTVGSVVGAGGCPRDGLYGITQKKLPEDLVVQAQPLGARLKRVETVRDLLPRYRI